MLPAIHDLHAELVIVGNGTPQQAAWFVEEFHIDSPVFTNPDRTVYQAVGAKHGLRTTYHPRVFRNAWRTFRRGYRQTKRMGAPTQQGGVFIILPDGSMPYRYRSDIAGDHPNPNDILHALRLATDTDTSTDIAPSAPA